MIWILIASIAIFFGFRFFSDLNKDNDDLSGMTSAKKFEYVVNAINATAFKGLGSVTQIDKRRFNLYEEGQNQIILFTYSTGHLTIQWKYKYFQKEVSHDRVFRNVRNLSIFEQQKLAETMINEMEVVIQKHQNSILE